MSGAAPGRLVGRDRDIDVLRSFVDRTATEGGSLLLSGDAGVGKSVLIDVVASDAASAGTRVLRATGAEFEVDVSFATLNQLLHPLFSEIDQLAPLHARAACFLGLEDGARSGRLVASNAAVELLVRAARCQSILIVVDDLPWIDRASSAVLGFIARRFKGSRVGFLAALRTGTESFLERTGLPEYALLPLDEAASAELLDDRFPALSTRTRGRLLAEAQGNPLALLELPATLAGFYGPVGPPPEVLPLSHRLQSAFAGRVTALPAATRYALLLAALDGTGDLQVLGSTASEGGILADIGPAERSQLITVDNRTGRLAFRHPLIRAAVVDLSTIDERRHVHEELAALRVELPARRA